MDKNKLRQVIVDQQQLFKNREGLIEREIALSYYLKGNEIVVITGIRRCGKSSLLRLIAQHLATEALYLNFDDVRLVEFDVNNFQDVQDICIELYEKQYSFFLDEVQNVLHWERWVNTLYEQGIKVFVTGSNAVLLSSEIATFLTGRNKCILLFPFSFPEYLKIKGLSNSPTATSIEQAHTYKAFLDYFEIGGFPLIIRNNDIQLSAQYFEDILYKDIIYRYRVREAKEIKDLIVFLLSHVGRIYSYATLKQITGIKSLSTIKNFIDYFQRAFVLHEIRRFDYSLKKQKISSAKVYSADTSFLKTVAFSFSENIGWRLENLVLIELKRRNKEIYYHSGKKECDFVIKKQKIIEAIQVVHTLSNPLVRKREVEGILDAMTIYNLKEGRILTLEEEMAIDHHDKKIYVQPVWKWLLSRKE